MSESLRLVLLDTSVIVDSFRRKHDVLERLSVVRTVVTSTILAELYHGALKAQAAAKEMDKIALLMQSSVVLMCDHITARTFAQVRYELELQGQPIPLHDMWIAATALQHHLPLATKDRHFERVPGLVVERW